MNEERRKEPLKIGEMVRIIESGMAGEIVKVSPKSVTVIVGSISTVLSSGTQTEFQDGDRSPRTETCG